mmetsp:Transcript_8994/g.17831  ORF Transcript_8994/g.17831 Transcript_8994/m.17831 type:complete len:93 (-) Transcript_8994:238-516(-)
MGTDFDDTGWCLVRRYHAEFEVCGIDGGAASVDGLDSECHVGMGEGVWTGYFGRVAGKGPGYEDGWEEREGGVGPYDEVNYNARITDRNSAV